MTGEGAAARPLDIMTEADWRAVATWDSPRPPPPDLVPGALALNLLRLEEWRRKEVAWRMCRAERLLHGIPQDVAGEDRA